MSASQTAAKLPAPPSCRPALSDAKLAANRTNALKSTGPKTPEGKARSRANAYRHGMAGDGVVLVDEDRISVAQMTAELVDDLRPRGRMARLLVRQIAVMAVRLEHCREHAEAATDHRVRHAVEAFEESRLAKIDKAIDWIMHEPATNARILRQTPEGVARMIKCWRALERELIPEEDRVADQLQAEHPAMIDARRRLDPRVGYWDFNLLWHAEALMGRRSEEIPTSRLRVLTNVVMNETIPERIEWAKGEVHKIILEQIAELQTRLESFDTTILDLDRAEAPRRALFDTGPEATLARRYEANAERILFRSLQELKELPNTQPNPLEDLSADPTVEEDPTDDEDNNEVEDAGPAPRSAMGSFRAKAPVEAVPEPTRPRTRGRHQKIRRTASLASFRQGVSPPA